jgi:hypothetical protein
MDMQISFVLSNFLKKRFMLYQELNVKFQDKREVMEKVNKDESENTKVIYNQKKDQDERRRILEALKSLSNVDFAMEESPNATGFTDLSPLSMTFGMVSPHGALGTGSGLKTEFITPGQLQGENSVSGLGALTATLGSLDIAATRKSRKKEGFLLVNTIHFGQGGGQSKAQIAMNRLGNQGWKKVCNSDRDVV